MDAKISMILTHVPLQYAESVEKNRDFIWCVVATLTQSYQKTVVTSVISIEQLYTP